MPGKICQHDCESIGILRLNSDSNTDPTCTIPQYPVRETALVGGSLDEALIPGVKPSLIFRLCSGFNTHGALKMLRSPNI